MGVVTKALTSFHITLHITLDNCKELAHTPSKHHRTPSNVNAKEPVLAVLSHSRSSCEEEADETSKRILNEVADVHDVVLQRCEKGGHEWL
jgi:hypothetical protein